MYLALDRLMLCLCPSMVEMSTRQHYKLTDRVHNLSRLRPLVLEKHKCW